MFLDLFYLLIYVVFIFYLLKMYRFKPNEKTDILKKFDKIAYEKCFIFLVD